jgi:aspartate kinase
MRVYKFGGASVKDGAGIRNLAHILEGAKDNLVIVVSAFGKTTNALESVLGTWYAADEIWKEKLNSLVQYHRDVMHDLVRNPSVLSGEIEISFAKLRDYLSVPPRFEYDQEYDQVVSYGELWSTMIVAEYLKSEGAGAEWVDIRKVLITDNRYRDANILRDESQKRALAAFDFRKVRMYVTQGFIGGTFAGFSTTLGREGSDYTAALLGNMLDAESVTVWKDVPGIMNADPRWLSDAEMLEEISYREAVEMTFSGAKVIHPKTIKPLHNKKIPLYVRSFIESQKEGTTIKEDASLRKLLPVYIRKEDQILISILPKDFSFVMGESLGIVFQAFASHGIKVNLVEASAVSINVCVDDERGRIDALLAELGREYSAVYNGNAEMLTIRHYTGAAIERITRGREILLEQRTRSTVRFVVRKTG